MSLIIEEKFQPDVSNLVASCLLDDNKEHMDEILIEDNFFHKLAIDKACLDLGNEGFESLVGLPGLY